jgi:S-DNA-T family DNA segregation ATPase FtsK/SpoIIIE
MSEEERMNTVVPLMDIQLGDEEENEECEENNDEISDYNDEEIENKASSSFDDFENVDFDFIDENAEKQSSIPNDPLFQSAHQDFDINQSEENQEDDLCEDENDEYEDYDEDEKENEEFEVPSEKVEVVQKPQVIPSVPKRQKNAPYRVPSEGLLTSYPDGEYWIIDSDTQKAAVLLKETLSEFKIEAEVTGIRKGPVITMFEILPAPGVKLSKIVALQDNIALRLAASSIRIVAPIPGKSAVGIEVPNKERAIVSFKELIETETAAYKKWQFQLF